MSVKEAAKQTPLKEAQTKKVANKKSTKKAAKKATKKSSSKSDKKKVFKKISQENYFVLADGRRIDHYVTLAHLLGELEEDIIRHHISDLHNDFSRWVADVFSEEDLAEKIRVVHDPDKIRLIIYKHIIDKHLR